MQRKLSFENTPPLSVPLRFFLTAPVFALLAGGLLTWYGSAALSLRWSPVTLAITHLLTLGVLTMSMIGALLQLLQVVVGIELARIRLTATVVHAALVPGTCALVCAFLFAVPLLFQMALVFLAISFGWLFAACLVGMWRINSVNATFTAMRLALLALCFTVVLGGLTVGALTGFVALPLSGLANLHLSWGMIGWLALLVIGVAYQVVPMFLVTQVYPRRVCRYLATVLFVLLMLWTSSRLLYAVWPWLERVLSFLLALGLALFAAVTLGLLRQRKRRVPDTTVRFWYVSAISLLAACILWVVTSVFGLLADTPGVELMLGMLVLIGFGYSVINGMLYKIVPFLIWYQLQTKLTNLGIKAPSIRKMISDRLAAAQFYAHLLALCSMMLAAIFPAQFARLAGMLLMISSCWLWVNLLRAAYFYRANLTIAH